MWSEVGSVKRGWRTEVGVTRVRATGAHAGGVKRKHYATEALCNHLSLNKVKPLPNYLPNYLPTYLPTYLTTSLTTYLPTYLPPYLRTRIVHTGCRVKQPLRTTPPPARRPA